jgi:hypothetical protein
VFHTHTLTLGLLRPQYVASSRPECANTGHCPRVRRRGQIDPKRTPDVMQKSIRLCEIGWVDLRCPKFGRVLEVFGLARAPAVTSRRQKALRHFSQLGALNLCAVGPWRRREGLESDAARWSFESREVFGAMLAQRRLVERGAGE